MMNVQAKKKGDTNDKTYKDNNYMKKKNNEVGS